jgi:hypothetical protein
MIDPWESSQNVLVDYYEPMGPRGFNNFYASDSGVALDLSGSIGSAIEDTMAMTSYNKLSLDMAIDGSVVDLGLWYVFVDNSSVQASLPDAENDLRGCSKSAAN